MIGIIDSGIGGKGIEKEIQKLLPASPAGGPKVKIIYLADTKNFSYGTKKISILHKILEKNINFLIKKGAKIIVLACNSATVSSVKYLRKKFQIPIIGVEPAIKPAAEISKTKKIAIFATPITSKSQATDDLISKYCKYIKVYKIPFKNLASQIERGETKKYTPGLALVWSKYKNKNIDTIVLGCTHYTLIRPQIQKIVGPNIKIIDSNQAVARQVKKVYDSFRRKK